MLDSAVLKATFKEAMQELEAEQKSIGLTFSSCSDGALKAFLARLNVGVEVGDPAGLFDAAITFNPFQWQATEDSDTPRAREHLEEELKRFGIKFGKGGYQLYDVHTKKQLLNLDDRKTGKLSGGTDLILCPHGIHSLGLVQQICVVVELKTEATALAEGLGAYTSQATLELIAANYYSNQMTVVVLTDLKTGASIFTLKRVDDGDDNVNIVVFENLTVSQAAQYVAHHLAQDCVPSKSHRLGASAGTSSSTQLKEADVVLNAYKKARVSPLEDALVWEHFQDMIHDSAPGTRDRAEVINELYRACDFHQPAYLSMYV